jgi:hypothetical protein
VAVSTKVGDTIMGAVYKKKRRSCPLCKPHKMGLAPKNKPQERQAQRLAKKEIADARVGLQRG